MKPMFASKNIEIRLVIKATLQMATLLAVIMNLNSPAVAQALPAGNATPATEQNEFKEVIELSPFSVSADKDGGYSARQTMLGSRTAQAVIDLPSSIVIVNKQLIDDLNATNIQQAINVGVSGVTQNQTISDDFNIRGFRAAALRNGITRSINASQQMYDVERIEVLKGPAGLQLGNNSFLGGAVNLISIKPTATPSGYIRTTISDDSFYRSEGNVSGPLVKNEDYAINYRLTGGHFTADRAKEIEGDDSEVFLGGGLDFFFGKDTSLSVTGYRFKDTTYFYWNDFLDVGAPGTPLPTAGTLRKAKLHPNSSKQFSSGRSREATWENIETSIDVTFLTRLTPNLDVRAFYSFFNLKDHRRIVRGITVQQDNFTLNRQFIPLLIDAEEHSFQLDVLHNWDTKWFELNSSLGLDWNSPQRTQDQSVIAMPALDTRSQDFPNDDAFFAVPRPGAGLPNLQLSGSDINVFTYYLQENLKLFNERLILVGGRRWLQPGGTSRSGTTVTQLSKKRFNVGKLGVVVKIRPWLSAYYTDAENVFTAPGGRTDRFAANDQLGNLFKDQEGILEEYGVKFDHSFTPKLTMYGSVARFDMSLTNVRTFGDLGNGVEGIIQSASDNTEGWEFDYGASYTIGQGSLTMIATYFNGDSKIAADPKLQVVGFAREKISFLAKYSW